MRKRNTVATCGQRYVFCHEKATMLFLRLLESQKRVIQRRHSVNLSLISCFLKRVVRYGHIYIFQLLLFC